MLKLGNYLRFSHLVLAFLLWQISALLLPPPFLPTLFSSSISYHAEYGRKHPCGCPLEEAACHSCRCFACRGSCCTGFKKNFSQEDHPNGKNSSTIFIRVVPCGGPEELNVNSFGKVKYLLTYFTFLLGIRSIPLAQDTLEKPENLSFKPSVPPPEITPLFSTAPI